MSAARARRSGKAAGKAKAGTETSATPLTYLYALADDGAAGTLPAGVPGLHSPRRLEVGRGLTAVVASAPRAGFDAEAIERGLRDLDWVSEVALGHAAVVEALQAAGAVIPMKLFTLFHDDRRAVAHAAERGPRLRRILARVRGHEEWGVRLALAAKAPPSARAKPPASGTGFLLAKKAQKDADRERLRAGAAVGLKLHRELAARASDDRRLELPAAAKGSALLLDAVFLVPKAGRRRFLAAAEKQRQRLLPLGHEVTWSGPWPPYNFVAVGEGR